MALERNFLSLCLLIMYVFSSCELLCIDTRANITGGWWTAKSSNFLQTSGLPITVNSLDNSDDTICKTKLYQVATSFYLSTFGPNSMYVNLKREREREREQKYPYQISFQTSGTVICALMSAALNLEKKFTLSLR